MGFGMFKGFFAHEELFSSRPEADEFCVWGRSSALPPRYTQDFIKSAPHAIPAAAS